MEMTTERIREAAIKYKELAEISQKYKWVKPEFERCSRRVYKFEKVLTFFLLGALASIVAIIVVCVLSLVRYGMIYDSLGDPHMYDVLYDEWVASLPKLSMTVGMIASVIVLPLSVFGGVKSAKKGLRIATERNTEVRATLDQFIKQNGELMGILPKSYRYPLAADFIAEVLESGRADTMKEALNLYEEQLHRWKMENKMNKLIEEQKKSYTAIWYI